MPDKSPDQMSREELLEARAKVERQLELGSGRSSDQDEIREELRQILEEINAELADAGEPAEVKPAETETIDPDFGEADDTGSNNP